MPCSGCGKTKPKIYYYLCKSCNAKQAIRGNYTELIASVDTVKCFNCDQQTVTLEKNAIVIPKLNIGKINLPHV